MNNQITIPDIKAEMLGKLTAYQQLQQTITGAVKELQAITQTPVTVEGRNQAHSMASEANRAIKRLGDARLELTRPLDSYKATITSHEKETIAPLLEEISRVGKLVKEYDDEVARQQEIERQRIEAERLARIEAERKEQERILKVQTYLVNWGDGWLKFISQASEADLNSQKKPGIAPEQYAPHQQLAIDTAQSIALAWDNRLAFLAQQRQIDELKQSNDAVQAEQAAQAAAQLEEQKRLDAEKAEQDRIRREQEAEKLRLQEESEARQRDLIARQAEEKRLKEMAAAKMRGVTSGIASWEITDISQVPLQLLKITIVKTEVKKWLKDHDSIPGMRIEFEDKLILNG